jgi:DNA (cytosine-5)-methyltransferase 1
MLSIEQLTAISLFSGAGGDTLGMKDAGIKVVGYVEFDKNAIKTHEHNFNDCKMIGEDITKITDETFSEYKGVDIIFGGFPCQSFSQGGKKNPDDKRGFLYQEFVRAASIIKPKVIIGENVKGLLSRKMKNGTLFIDNIMNDFSKIGYDMKYELFNMSEFCIPQTRQRILIYGIKKDLKLSCTLSNIEKPVEKKYNKNILEFSLQNAMEIKKVDIIKEIKKGICLEKLSNKDKESGKPPTNLVKCYNLSEISFKTRNSPTHSCIIDPEDFSRTILCSYGRMPRLFVSIHNFNGYYLRPYTINELKLIQGFPKSFEFKGEYINQINQIGNAVPPSFVKIVMLYIKSILLQETFELVPNFIC